jgi:hypothetical protein
MSSPSEKYNLHLLKEILKTPDYCSYVWVDKFRPWRDLWWSEELLFLNKEEYDCFVEWVYLKLASMEYNNE